MTKKLGLAAKKKISMSLMEEPIAARGAYFVFLYILVTVPENSSQLSGRLFSPSDCKQKIVPPLYISCLN